MKPLWHNNRSSSTANSERKRTGLKRTPSITFDAEVPKIVPRKDQERIPAIPNFDAPVTSVDIAEGGTACFDCKIRGNPPPTIYWCKNGDAISVSNSQTWTETAFDGKHVLVIDNATIADRGTYRCTIVNKYGRASSSGVLRVHDFPSILKKSTSEDYNDFNDTASVKSRVSQIDSGDSSTFSSLRSHTSKEIKLASETGDTNSSRKSSIKSTSSTSSFPPVFSDEQSSSSTPKERESMRGLTPRAPQFILKPQSKVAEKGKNVTFTCEVSGLPPPTVHWYKSTVKLVSSDHHTLDCHPSGNSTLEIRKLSEADAGTYRCVTYNSAGRCSCSIDLTLTGEDLSTPMANDRSPAFTQVIQAVEARIGERARFQCKVDGRPKPKVEWSKDGKVLSVSSRVRIMEVYGGHALSITRLQASDSGVYSVLTTNHAGSETCSAQLQVHGGILPRTSPGNHLSTHNSPNTSAATSPSISPKLGRAATSRLTARSASPLGSKSSPGRGSPAAGTGGPPPRRRGPGFILRPRPQSVAPGERLRLKCTLLGHPKPTVTWEKDGELVDEDKTDGHIKTSIDGNDYYLEIDHCEVADAGKFAVTARNSLGKQTAAIVVTVTDSGGDVGSKANKPKVKSNGTVPGMNQHSNTNSNSSTRKQQSGGNAVSNRYRSSVSPIMVSDERKPAQAIEFILPINPKLDERKGSPTGSVSSTFSSHSRLSTTSSRSNTSSKQEMEDDAHHLGGRSSWRRSNAAPPTFLRRLSSTQVLEGEELMLQCEVSGDSEAKMAWLRNGTEIDEDEVFTSFRGGVARLRLRDVQPQHAGEYVCKARNDGGAVQCSSRVTVKVKKIQTRPRFVKAPADVRVDEGETLTLEAEVEGVPTPEIVWSLDGEEVGEGQASYFNNLAKLILRDVKVSNSGQYMCSALNAEGEDSVACRVRVKKIKIDIPPEFTAPLTDVNSSEGDDVCLRCMVTGIPEPTVKWMYNEEILDSEEGIEITFQGGVAALMLENATEEDTGLYTCLAVNTEGKATTTCKVMVKAAAKPERKSTPTSAPKITIPFDEYIRVQEGDTLTLDCAYSGYPEPKVTWTVNEKEALNARTSSENGKAHFVLSPVNTNHVGRIRCSVENFVGKATHEARINVRSKRTAPAFEKLLPASVEIKEESEACFECKVTGHPQPRVSWTREGRSLSVLSSETLYEDGVASVRIRKAGPRDAGKYVCIARNLSGDVESVCNVTVIKKQEENKKPALQPPTFNKELENVTLNDGQDIRLECKVTGLPVPQIMWEVDGHKLDPEDGDVKLEYKNSLASLLLEDAMPEDSGEYRCIATNSAGKSYCTCQVIVKGEPEKPEEIEPTFPIVLEDQTIKEGRDILLNCKVVGNPRPKITWLLDGEEIFDADVKYAEDGTAELLLTEAHPEDEGVYTCIAENPLKRVMCSCKVTIEVPPRAPKKRTSPGASSKRPEDHTSRAKSITIVDSPIVKPTFVEALKDCLVQDGSAEFKLSCRVTGNPVAKWFIEDEEIENSDDFRMIIDGDLRILQFNEVFPDDSGTYTCLITNDDGNARSSCQVTVQEIDGEPPIFLTKPKPVNVSAGEKASFTCKVDGAPAPTVQWLFCNRPIQDRSRIRITEANDGTHSLEIPQVSPQDAGRYSVCCRNLLGDVTCTVSLIVSDAKRQETRKDFRDVLKKPSTPKSNATNRPATQEQVNYRSVLRTKSADKEGGKGRAPSSGSEDPSEDAGVAYREALQTSVKTKALTEDERKARRAEQKDFRGNLVRKVETKVTTPEAMKAKGTEQLDFREEALKTKVKTKSFGQEDLKTMHAEQVDFRSETIKSKVVTKAFREESVKAKRAEQIDFRKVLSSTKNDGERDRPKEDNHVIIADISKAKWKKDATSGHNTVATKRTRHRGQGSLVPERNVQPNGSVEEPVGSAPVFSKDLTDVTTKDGEAFQLVCHVAGNPLPKITWCLEEANIKPEADITMAYKGDECSLAVAESFPDDEGKYTCIATNEHGKASCSCYVTVLTNEPLSPEDGTSKTKFVKKKSSKEITSCEPAVITDGPKDTVVIRGNPISLYCNLGGTSPFKVVWRKGRNEIKHSSQCNIETSTNASALTIRQSQRDDSGCYTLQVTNAGGVDQYSVSVKVVDVPDPPGKPFVEPSSNNSMVMSWYGSAYDGGSSVLAYIVEMAKVKDGNHKDCKRWTEVSTTKSTSHTATNLEQNAAFMFRVSAQNEHGTSKPGPASDIARNLAVVENGENSTDEEEEGAFVKYGPVVVKHNEKFSSKYDTREKLGQGRFGKVHRVIDRSTSKPYAAKIMRALKAKDKEAVALEIEIMNSLRHPKLVQLVDAYIQGREVTMVMDLVAGGELFERVIDEDFELTEAACIKYMRQICDGVRFMHDSMIVHLDLKPENIMCINKTGTQIKLIDFGLARRFNPKEPIRVMFGTPEFVAPEVIDYDTIGFQTDMWSVGVICYILLSGLSPFSGDNDQQTLSNITAVRWDFDDEAFDQISDDAKDFISNLLVHSLKSRYTVEKALEHRWLKKDTKKMKTSKLNTKNLKRFLARRKWQKTGNAVRALQRLGALAGIGTAASASNGQQRESGFLSALKAQLIREKDEEEHDKRKPEFIETFDDVEVIEGSAARFQCTIIGKPDPEIMWYMDGEPIKESRHFRISYNEDDVCTLLITEATEADEAEYTCTAMNSEGEVTHSAELIVITPVNDQFDSSACNYGKSFYASSSSSSINVIAQLRTVTRWMREGETAVFTLDIYPKESRVKSKLTKSDKKSDGTLVTTKWYKIVSQDSRLKQTDNDSNEQLQRFEPSDRFDMGSSDTTYELEGYKTSYFAIKEVTAADSGWYHCVGKDEDGEINCRYRLIVDEDALIHKKSVCLTPHFVKILPAQNVAEGSEALLRCTVIGKPTPVLYWFMYGTCLQNNERYRFTEEGTNASLSIQATKWYDSGRYTVRAINPLGEAECTMDLYVAPADHQEIEFEGAPVFLERAQSTTLKIGSTVSFKCTIAGIPKPKVYWKKGDNIVMAKDNLRYRITETCGGGYSFVVKKARLIDCGKYICIAENERGVAICAAFLTQDDTNISKGLVSANIAPLAPIFVTRPHGATVRAGFSASFQCTVHGVPEPILTWYTSDGKKISTDHHFLLEDIHSHHTLRIMNTTCDDGGHYFCTAVNDAGEASCSAKLEVFARERTVAPSIKFGADALKSSLASLSMDHSRTNTPTSMERNISTTKSVTLNEGKNAKICLTVRGFPRPEVTWYKDGQKIVTGNRYSLQYNGQLSQLRLSRVKTEDQGLYSILACNAGGLYTTLLRITVKEKPRPSVFFQPPQSTVALHPGADALIQCVLQNDAKHKDATWWKDQQKIKAPTDKYETKSDGAVRQLTVKSVTSNDQGDYRCQVADQSAVTNLRVCDEEKENMHWNESIINDENAGEKRKSKNVNNDPLRARDAGKQKDEIHIISGRTPRAMEVPENGTLILQHAISKPVSGCLWKLNGSELKNTDRCKINVKGSKHVLMLMQVSPEDAGKIEFLVPETNICAATTVKVQALPPAPVIPDVDLCGERGIRLSWEPPVNDPFDYEIDIYPDASKVWKKVGTVFSRAGVYLVENLEPGASYKFRLKARNDIGCSKESTTTSTVKIASLLRITQGLEDVVIEEGDTARFHVQLNQAHEQGDWFMNGLKLSSRGESCQIQASGNVHSLVMNNLTKTGKATIQFATDMPNGPTSSAQLTVNGTELKLVQGMTDVTITENSEATFTVALSKEVKKMGKWFHKGVEVEQTHDVTIEKRGEYEILQMKNIKSTASGKVKFELEGEPQVSCTAQLNVQSWYEMEPFQKVTNSLPDVTSIKLGEDAVFTVTLSSDKKCTPLWIHNGKTVPSNSKKYKVKQKGDKLSLIIRNVSEEDIGSIQCLVDKSTTATKLAIKDEQIPVCEIDDSSSPPLPVITFLREEKENLPKNVKLLEGERDFRLLCHLSHPDGEIEWRKDGSLIEVDSNDIMLEENGCVRSLHIGMVTCGCAGIYDCVMKTNNQEKFTFDVTVEELAFIDNSAKESSIKLTEGDNYVELSCLISNSGANVEWMKDGRRIVEHEKSNFKIIKNDNERKLVIDDVTTDVAGIYDCIIVSGERCIKQSFNVSVDSFEFVDYAIPSSSKRQLTFTDCDCEQKLTCELSRSKYEVEWRKDGIPIDFHDTNIKVTEKDCVRELIFERVTSEVAGNYDCVILTGDKTKKKSFQVSVEAVSFIDDSNDGSSKSITFLVGDRDVELTCLLSHSDVIVKWEKETMPLNLNHNNIKAIAVGRTRKLLFHDVISDVEGTYDCIIMSENKKKTKKTFYVSVEDVDFDDDDDFSRNISLEFVENERDAEMKCNLTHCDVAAEWRKDGIPLKDNNDVYKIMECGCLRKLVISDVTSEVAGRYECVIMRGEGKKARMFDVSVKEFDFADDNHKANVGDCFNFVEGDRDVKLCCRTNHCDAIVEWRKDGIPVNINDRSVNIIQSDCCHKLVFSEMETTAAGMYDCVIKGKNREKKKCFKVSVEVQQRIVTLLCTNNELTEGETLRLQAHVEPANAQLKWSRDNIEVTSKDKRVTFSEEGRSMKKLTIQQVACEDKGVYTCMTKHDSCSVNVCIGKTEISVVDNMRDIEVVEQSTATFAINLSRKPVGKETWSLNGRQLIETSNCRFSVKRLTYSATLANLTTSEAGVVTFVADNINESARLSVKAIPVMFSKRLSDISMTCDGETLLVCEVTSPSAEIVWFKDDTEINQNQAYVIAREGCVCRLKIRCTSDNDAGLYCCKTKDDETSCKLAVVKKITFEDLDESFMKKYSEGDRDVMLTCQLSHPDVRVLWKKDGVPINLNDDGIEVLENGCERKLKFFCVTQKLAGIYECVIVNDQDVINNECAMSKSFNVSVETVGFDDSPGDFNKMIRFKEFDHDAVLSCKLTHPDLNVQWRKDGEFIDQNNENFKILQDSCVRKLILADVTSEVAGVYECVITNEECMKKKLFNVSVEESFQRIVSALLTSMAPLKGETITLRVEVEPQRADAVWLKDGLMLSDTIDDKIKLSGQGSTIRSLTIADLTLDDTGVYSCETIHDSCFSKVTVTELEIEVVEGLLENTCEVGDTVTFQVRLSQTPKGLPVWGLKGNDAKNSANTQISARDLLYSLTLRDLRMSDSGLVTFAVDNVTEQALLDVIPPPAVFTKPLNDDVTTVYGSEAIFICELANDVGKVSWFKGSRPIEACDKYTFSREGRICKLKVKEVDEDDSGKYICVSDVSETSCTLHVEKPPLKVVEGLDDVTVTEGDKASFCIRLSQANVDLTWLRNGKTIREKVNKCEILSEGCWYALHMRKLSTVDSGEIKVVANGDAIDYALLQVKKTPVRFTKEIRDLVIDVKERAEFVCEVTEPDADVTWYRNDAEIEESKGMNFEIYKLGVIRKLVISRAYMHHEAKYSCVTQDGVRTSAELFVKVPPVFVVRPLADARSYIGDDVEFKVVLSTSEVEGEWLIDSLPAEANEQIGISQEEEKRYLRMRNVQQSSIITYRVDNNVTTSCRHDVRERPVAIERRLSDVAVHEGSDVKFECFFSKPDLPVVWYVDDEELKPSEKFEVETVGCKHTLKVHDVRYDDEANYTCRYRHRRTSSELTVLEARVDVVKPLCDVTCHVGDCCILECILSLPLVNVSWCKDGRSLMGANARVTETKEHVVHELFLENLKRPSSGSYSITYLNKTLSNSEVRVKQRPVSVIEPLRDVYVEEDIEEVSLLCVFSQTPCEVFWTRDGKQIKQDSPHFFVENDGTIQRLTITQKLHDSTRFACVIPKHCETSCHVTFNRLQLDLLKSLPETLTIIEGSNAEVSCCFSTPVNSEEVTLYIDDNLINDEDVKEHIDVSYREAELHIHLSNVHREYHKKTITVKCRHITTSSTVEVISVPDAPTNLKMVEQNRDLILRWNKPLHDGGRRIVNYLIYTKTDEANWVEEGCLINTNEYDETMASVICDLESGIEHWLRVAAVNEVGIGEFAQFDRSYVPQKKLKFDKCLDDVTLTEGQNLELWCELSRVSTDDVIWTLNDIEIHEDPDRICFYSYDVTRELVIEKVRAEESGEYRCTVGDISTECQVVVKRGPLTFIEKLKDMEVRLSDDIILSCVVSQSCFNVAWYFEGSPVEKCSRHLYVEEERVKTLTIKSSQRCDAGIYMCCVTNVYGDVISTKSNVTILPNNKILRREEYVFLEHIDVESDVFMSEDDEKHLTRLSVKDEDVLELCKETVVTLNQDKEKLTDTLDLREFGQYAEVWENSFDEKHNLLVEEQDIMKSEINDLQDKVEENVSNFMKIQNTSDAIEESDNTQQDENIESNSVINEDIVLLHDDKERVSSDKEWQKEETSLATLDNEEICDLTIENELDFKDKVCSDSEKTGSREDVATDLFKDVLQKEELETSISTDPLSSCENAYDLAGGNSIVNLSSGVDVTKDLKEESSTFQEDADENSDKVSVHSSSPDKQTADPLKSASIHSGKICTEYDEDESNLHKDDFNKETFKEERGGGSLHFKDNVSVDREETRTRSTDEECPVWTKRTSVTSLSDAYETAPESVISDIESYGSVKSKEYSAYGKDVEFSNLPHLAEEEDPASNLTIDTFDDVFNNSEYLSRSKQSTFNDDSPNEDVEYDIKPRTDDKSINIHVDEEQSAIIGFCDEESCRTESARTVLPIHGEMSIKDYMLEALRIREQNDDERMMETSTRPPKETAQSLINDTDEDQEKLSVMKKFSKERSYGERDLTESPLSADNVSEAYSFSDFGKDLSSSCVVIPIRPKVKKSVTTVVIDARTGETVTKTSKTTEITTAKLYSANIDGNTQGTADGFTDIRLPRETPEEKMARLFGVANINEEVEDLNQKTSLSESLLLKNLEVLERDEPMENDGNKEMLDTERKISSTKDHTLYEEEFNKGTNFSEFLDGCMQALETSQVTSDEVLSINVAAEEENRSGCRSNQAEFTNQANRGTSLSLTFKSLLRDQTVCAGNTVLFHCTLEAFPEPKVRWRKEGSNGGVTQLNDDTSGIEIKIIPGDAMKTECLLKIHRVSKLDAGEYYCTAVNELGESSCSALLCVFEEDPRISVKTGNLLSEEEPSVTMQYGEHVVISGGEGIGTYLSDDDVSISIPPPSDGGIAWSVQEPETGYNVREERWFDQQSKDSFTPVLAEERVKKKEDIAQRNQKPLTIHVLESIVVRESYSTTDSCRDSQSCTDTSRTVSSAKHAGGSMKSKKYRTVVINRSSRPSTAASFFTDSDSDCESTQSSVKPPEIYYAITSCGSDMDSSFLELKYGQPVEVMDSSSSREWLVRTKPTKHNPIRMGFVDPCYLSSRLFTPSPSAAAAAAGRIWNESLPSAVKMFHPDPVRQDGEGKQDGRQVRIPPEILSLESKSLSLFPDHSASDNQLNRKNSLISDLIREEEMFITCLKKVNYLISNAPTLSPAIDLMSHQLFGDLEGIEHFHCNMLLPDLKQASSSPHILSHVFLKHSAVFEQLHLTHIVNTYGSQRLVSEDDAIASGLMELSKQADADIAEIAQKPLQQLTLYQYYLKRLLHFKDADENLNRAIHDALCLLTDVPYKASMTRVWQNMNDYPDISEKCGNLLKEGVFQLVNLEERGFERRFRVRRIFLFENLLVVGKVPCSSSKNLSDTSYFDNAYEVNCLCLDPEPVGADVKTFTLTLNKSNRVMSQWSISLRCKTLSAKKTWCRMLQHAIDHAAHALIKQESTFSHLLHDVTVMKGKALYLFCYVTGKPPLCVIWTKGGEPLNYDHVILTKRDNGYCALHIKQVGVSDAGVYKCEAVDDVRAITTCVVTVESE